jgi:hypothetical protein
MTGEMEDLTVSAAGVQPPNDTSSIGATLIFFYALVYICLLLVRVSELSCSSVLPNFLYLCKTCPAAAGSLHETEPCSFL